MRILGVNSGVEPTEAWRVALKDPLGREIRYVAEVSERGLATSGNYESWFERDGRRWSHIIDPKTGLPLPDGLAGVTVVHPDSAAAADALATAFSVMGPEGTRKFLATKGPRLFPQGLEVVLSVKDGDELTTVELSLDESGRVSEREP
jgi:thiamine biosynthesis lipoprotein ApbE